MPVATYSHADGCSITGGYVYRGSNASLRGRYIYGDYCSGTIWSFKIAGGKATGLDREGFQIDSVSPSVRTTRVSSTRSRTRARSTA